MYMYVCNVIRVLHHHYTIPILVTRRHNREGLHHAGGSSGGSLQDHGGVRGYGADERGDTGWEEVPTSLPLLCSPQVQ